MRTCLDIWRFGDKISELDFFAKPRQKEILQKLETFKTLFKEKQQELKASQDRYEIAAIRRLNIDLTESYAIFVQYIESNYERKELNPLILSIIIEINTLITYL